MCEFYNNKRGCQEEHAEYQKDLESANFCDYFKPSKNSFKSSNQTKSDIAKAEFAALFGDEVPEKSQDNEALSPAEKAEKKLRDMLNGI